MDPLLHRHISTGRVINIQRSNGSIHKAMVRTVSEDRSFVSVEWNEDGVLKGKEIDLDDVITANPELAELRAADVKENIPVQENVKVQKKKHGKTSSKIPAPREAARGRSRMSVIAESQCDLQESEMGVDPCTSMPTRNYLALPELRDAREAAVQLEEQASKQRSQQRP